MIHTQRFRPVILVIRGERIGGSSGDKKSLRRRQILSSHREQPAQIIGPVNILAEGNRALEQLIRAIEIAMIIRQFSDAKENAAIVKVLVLGRDQLVGCFLKISRSFRGQRLRD
ncbi:MAG: hypothetical protein ACXV8A_08570 [Chthoniobacterales bacterium]